MRSLTPPGVRTTHRTQAEVATSSLAASITDLLHQWSRRQTGAELATMVGS